MNIGQASAASGVSAKMIRHYESIGLLQAPLRGENGYRVYGDDDLKRLAFIRHARDVGFALTQIKSLLQLWRDRHRASADVKRIAVDQIEMLKARKREIETMIAGLEELTASCHGDARAACPILDGLAKS
ncbi:MAG TPA: Cu(I)-responsive transcriptional regulator [Alphaproteobacteria bacterium]|nr:Cu(I)-responsive transcriptional regulator [Alphaproteobacteria bacterium]